MRIGRHVIKLRRRWPFVSHRKLPPMDGWRWRLWDGTKYTKNRR